jgi:MoaA/NifB/PqqE/SkfB family radical SAM enzyme
MNFWNKQELSQMHIELTNACNAACPMCVRFFRNSPNVRPDLEIGQITIDKFKQYFPPHIIQQTALILFCGVHGDPGTARDLYEICEYIAQCSDKTSVRMNTNGGMRRAAWWSKLGKLFAAHAQRDSADSYWEIIFSIDGLEDTNHLYRRNVEWKILMDNVQAFINAGGRAAWDFLIFKHNEHQILEAQTLSKQIGFREFIPKKALGVDFNDELKIMPALTKDGELDYIIEAPTEAKNRNLQSPIGTMPLVFYPFKKEEYREMKESSADITEQYKQQAAAVYDRIAQEDFKEQDSCTITCKAMTPYRGKEIFVDNFGRVMPCCYIGTHLNGIYNDTASLQLHNHMNAYGWDHFSLDLHSLEEILDGGHLNKVFADSWSRDSVRNGKLAYCADTCGKKSKIDNIFSHELNDKAAKMEKFRNQVADSTCPVTPDE